jgi:hypothetical protein
VVAERAVCAIVGKTGSVVSILSCFVFERKKKRQALTFRFPWS